MSDYLKHAYEQIGAGILSKWGSIYPILVKAVVFLLCAVIVWAFFKRLLKRVRKRVTKYEFVRDHDEIFGLIQKAVLYAVIFVTGIYMVHLFKIPILEKAFYAALIILLAIAVKDFTLHVLSYLEDNLVKRTDSKVDDIVFDLLKKFSGVIILAVAILLALDALGINVVPFVAGAGIAGIAIGFAAKDTLSNLIAGILLIIDRPFEVGDRIEVT
jgi:small-conductance mechanosensitive channel